MPAVARADKTDVVSIHECGVNPRTDSGSPNVFVNNISAHRFGDTNTPHPYVPVICPLHATTINLASPNVFVNNRGIARLGDTYTCGIQVITASKNIFVNG